MFALVPSKMNNPRSQEVCSSSATDMLRGRSDIFPGISSADGFPVTGQSETVGPCEESFHPPLGADLRVCKHGKEPNNTRTLLQGAKNSNPDGSNCISSGGLSCRSSINVVIEEICLLPQDKNKGSKKGSMQRRGICDLPPARETRSDESNGWREIRQCGDIISRCIYYRNCGPEVTNSFCSFLGKQLIDEEAHMTDGARASQQRGITRNSRIGLGHGRMSRYTSARFGNSTVRQQTTTDHDQLGAVGTQQLSLQLQHENATETTSQMILSDDEVLAKGMDEAERKGEEDTARYVFANSEGRKGQHVQLREVSDLEERNKAKGKFSCCYTADSPEGHTQRMICEALNEEGNKKEETSASFLGTAEAQNRQTQQTRRRGVCEAVDKAAAGRRRARVLKKRLFGDDLPIDDELITEGELRNILHKRF